MTTPTLRPYQAEAVQAIRLAFANRRRSVLFVLPTGGGKTVVFSHIAEQAAAKGNRIGILVHRVELLEQASASLSSLGVRHGLIAANRSMDLSAPVQVASVATLARRLHKLPPDLFQLLVVDEAHHSNAGTWGKVLSHCATARILGVTATPIRCDGRGLGEWYQELILGPSPAWLTEQGYLAPARVLAPPGVSMSGVRKRMGDYDLSQAGELLQEGQAMGDALGHYRQHLDGRTAIAFCCSISHAQAVAELFQREGIAAASIDGTMDAATRRRLLEQLGSGELKVLTSCALIGEGVDVPSVSGCILLRPTQSVALHLQMIGRCLRPQDGKRAVILDHVGNTLRLGHHLDDREWSLEGIPKRQREAAPSVKVCPRCFCAMASAKSECPECGHVFATERRELEHVDGQLQELKRNVPPGGFVKGDMVRHVKSQKIYTVTEIYIGSALPYSGSVDVYGCLSSNKLSPRTYKFLETELELDVTRERRAEQAMAMNLETLIEVGKRRGMKNPRGWAKHVLAARQTKGQWSRVA